METKLWGVAIGDVLSFANAIEEGEKWRVTDVQDWQWTLEALRDGKQITIKISPGL